MSSNVMAVAGLGRPFTLGMLYNARKDELIPGFALWDDKTLQGHTVENSHKSSAFEVSASDSTEAKCSLLDIEASLKASFLGGLVEVGGSAKYLNDQKKFKNQSRVTFQYKATTSFKEMPLTNLGTLNEQQRVVLEKSLATHVVTGILYGANAFFVFDSEKLDASSVQDIQGSMQAVIKKIPAFDVKGEVKINLSDNEKDLVSKFSCKFYGDFILERNPATFEEAAKTYVELPKILREIDKNTVPLKVWLMPLVNFDSNNAQLMSEISIGLVREIEDALEDLKEMKERCNDSQADVVGKNFPQIREQLNRFQKLCNYYTSKLKQTVAEKLPSIRGGKEDESSLKQLFVDRDKSPFSHEKLSQWLDYKEREINIIRSCLEIMGGVKIVPNQSELDREVLAAGVVQSLCFVFTSLGSADPRLDAMCGWLDSLKLGTAGEEPWFFSDQVLAKMREDAKTFNELYKTLKNSSQFRFLVAPLQNKNYKGATIYHYKEGQPTSQNFSKPIISNVTTASDRRDFLWYYCDLTLDPYNASSWLILSQGNKKATCGSWQAYPDNPDRFDPRPQVLCKEGLSGRHYWEVEWSTGYQNEVGVGVTYRRIGRKKDRQDSGLGSNEISWYFGEKSGLEAWHNGKIWNGSTPSTGCSRVGVYLDWPAGTLSFYNVSSSGNTLNHLYTFHDRFTEPLYPGFYKVTTGRQLLTKQNTFSQ
uniref:B30.2/SPRY domain-containing protein n=1 Tax=Amphilophus citrinellus TaxID=61819 RepID=A0A3Q0SYQ1_AMPCI